MPKKLDLTGQQFGKLTVLHRGERLGGGATWVCQCDCGQKVVVRSDNLRNGRTKSCGCQRRKRFAEMTTVRRNNTSSVTGVEWLPLKRRWKASICFNRRRYYLGEYAEFEDAVEARRSAEQARKRAEESLRDNFLFEFACTQTQSGSKVR